MQSVTSYTVTITKEQGIHMSWIWHNVLFTNVGAIRLNQVI